MIPTTFTNTTIKSAFVAAPYLSLVMLITSFFILVQTQTQNQTQQHQPIRTNLNVDLFMRNFTIDPPRGSNDAVFDLPINLSGIWQFKKPFGGFALQYIWQECLEMTISGMGSPICHGPLFHGPLHHMIHDGKYLTEDILGDQFKDGAGEKVSWRSIVAEPTSLEKSYGAVSTSVFYVDNTVPGYEHRLNDGEYLEAAIRFIGSDGNLYFQQNSTLLGAGSAGILRWTKKDFLPCSYPYEPNTDYCMTKQSNGDYDNELASAFTPACCGHGYNGDTSIYTTIAKGSDKIGNCYPERSSYFLMVIIMTVLLTN